MTPIKKVEIIVDSVELEKLKSILDKRGIKSYTIIKNIQGKGDRGVKSGDGLTDVFNNVYVMIACTDEEINLFVEDVRKILRKLGGICLITEAVWIKH